MKVPDFLQFEPSWPLRSGYLQTLCGSQFPGQTQLPPRKTHKIQIDAENTLILLEIPAAEPRQPVVVLAHGMGGCSESGYIRRIAGKLHQKGMGVFMLNQRGSGAGMGLASSLWNGSSSQDFGRMVKYIISQCPQASILLAGFSLGANVLLKYLGEGQKIPRQVSGALAINPPVDLKVSSRILSSELRLFNWYFMKLIRQQAEAVVECFPDAKHPPLDAKTIWEFDAVYTAKTAGYRDAEEYYARASSGQFLANIEVPTTVLCSRDDPFIPFSGFAQLPMSLAVNFYAPEKGGHMGYICKEPTAYGDRRWMDAVVLGWARNVF
jgi:predicted alpha/beta-fold hydrolase